MGLRPRVFFALRAKKTNYYAFLANFRQFWLPVVTLVTLKRIQKVHFLKIRKNKIKKSEKKTKKNIKKIQKKIQKKQINLKKKFNCQKLSKKIKI